MLCCENLKLIVDNKTLVNNLSLTFLPGSLIYIKGSNGCGKSTLLRTLAGITSPKAGSVTFYEENIFELPKPYNLYIGHKLAINNELTVLAQIEFWANIFNSKEMIPAAINFWQLEEVLDQRISSLSAGNLKKLALSKLTCCHSLLWLLDEIETNLDENNFKLLQTALYSKIYSGGIVIVTTHNKEYLSPSIVINLEDYKC